MPRQRYYSPQIKRFLITCLYFQAKAEKVSMTVLTNRLLENVLRHGDGWTKAREMNPQATNPPKHRPKVDRGFKILNIARRLAMSLALIWLYVYASLKQIFVQPENTG